MPPASPHISLLGVFELQIGVHRVQDKDIPSRKAPALLKLIALARGQELMRDQAMDALWPALDPNKARAQRYKAVHQLRKTLAGAGAAAGTYVKFLGDEGSPRTRSAYRSDGTRLRALKNRCDPGNLFRLNQNIPPSTTT